MQVNLHIIMYASIKFLNIMVNLHIFYQFIKIHNILYHVSNVTKLYFIILVN